MINQLGNLHIWAKEGHWRSDALARTIEELNSLRDAFDKLIQATDIVCKDLRSISVWGEVADFVEITDALEAAIEEARECRGISSLEGGAAIEK